MTGALVFDSKDMIEQIIAAHPVFGSIFNASNKVGTPTFKNRSDDKGPEVEGIAVHQVNGHTYVFAALERIGGVMIFNADNPLASYYVGYYNNRSVSNPNGPDLGTEGIIIIAAQDSPNGQDLLILANEVSSTVTTYQMNTCAVASNAVLVADTTVFCAGDSTILSFNAATNVVYTWLANGQALNTTNDTLVVSQSGLYALVLVNDTLACSDTTNVIQVEVNPNPTIFLVSDTTVCDYNLPLQLTAAGNATSFLWSNGTSGASTSITQAGTYIVTGELIGCTDSASIVVVIDPCLGIFEEDLFKLSFYPNPTQNGVYGTFNMPISATISILTMDGRVLFIDQVKNQSEIMLDFSSFARGSYLIKLDQNGETNLTKVIKE